MDGLDDWVYFYRVHRLVYLANPDASVGSWNPFEGMKRWKWGKGPPLK
ncbi:Uncharacterised protein [Mycobacteroides abscessus subsp. abscessus]|nr:hypothetical protein [Mycobacteroides abscessus]MBN7498440.1 hypothetical protein [Mycobacteroides abscessus subsp. abscessus]MDM2171496.1 hypothetical protein [Mycobacteroides abscessus]MDM2178559.1 hypothetical protein [Mycobacteroides abscessus]MDM2207556.1 hypothetical protein [Mycobacteroides abscessus]MDM2211711.1 hypothetical protein [Mycobacteroides abscessus]